MDKAQLTTYMQGTLTVKAQDVANLAILAHEMRVRFSDPRLRSCTRGLFAETIEAVDALVLHAGQSEEQR